MTAIQVRVTFEGHSKETSNMDITGLFLLMAAVFPSLFCLAIWLYEKFTGSQSHKSIVGPSYWGSYQEGLTEDSIPLRKIAVPVKREESSYDRAIGMF